MISPTPCLGCCNNCPRSSWCWPTGRGSAERRNWQAAPTGFHRTAERDFWNISKRSHWMKKSGICRENLQLWPPFRTLVPFLWMINLCVVQCSHVQYRFPRVSKKCHFLFQNSPSFYLRFNFTTLFHGQMIIHTPRALNFFSIFLGRFTHFYFHIDIVAQSSYFWFNPRSFGGL